MAAYVLVTRATTSYDVLGYGIAQAQGWNLIVLDPERQYRGGTVHTALRAGQACAARP